MKRNTIFIAIIAILGSFYACEKDNLSDYAPNASLMGEIRDIETGELVEQDIINGSKIHFIELGWENPPTQTMVIKNDGTYQNDLMFAGDYKIIMNKGNYTNQDTLDFKMKKGQNTLSFQVTPYIRISNVDIKLRDGKIIAKFKMRQTTSDFVKSIALFAHSDISVSFNINTSRVIQTFDGYATDEEYQIVMDLSKEGVIKSGKSYYFRVGALSNAGEAKYNYAPAINVDL